MRRMEEEEYGKKLKHVRLHNTAQSSIDVINFSNAGKICITKGETAYYQQKIMWSHISIEIQIKKNK